MPQFPVRPGHLPSTLVTPAKTQTGGPQPAERVGRLAEMAAVTRDKTRALYFLVRSVLRTVGGRSFPNGRSVGSLMSTTKFPSGLEVSTFEPPPPGIEPPRADDAELTRRSFPRRPGREPGGNAVVRGNAAPPAGQVPLHRAGLPAAGGPSYLRSTSRRVVWLAPCDRVTITFTGY